jgi:uncharacterized membrane protein
MAAAASEARRSSSAALWLAAITLLGAFTRLWGLSVQSLWGDELYVQHVSALSSAREIVALIAAEDVHPPGFFLLMHVASELLGRSEAMLRLPSAFAGIAAIPVMFLLGRSLCSARVGLRAAALAAVSWFAIYYSQECRAYSLLFLGSALLGWLAVELGRRHGAGAGNTRGFAVGMFFAALALNYLHYFGLLLSALLALVLFYLALRGRYPLRPLAFVYGALALSYLPWLATLLSQYGRGEVWIARPKLARLVKPYAAMSNDQLAWLLALLLLGAAAGVLLARKRGEPQLGLRGAGGRAVLIALAWATLPTLIAFAISRLLLPVFTERNLIIVLPGVLLLAALALDAIERSWFRGMAVATFLAVGLLAYDLIAVRDYYRRPTKHQFREAALRVMQESAGARRPPLIVADVWYASYFDYYFRALGSDLRVGAVPRTMDHRRIVAQSRPAGLFCLEIAGKRRGKPRPPLCVFEGYREAKRWRLHGWVVRQLRPKDG